MALPENNLVFLRSGKLKKTKAPYVRNQYGIRQNRQKRLLSYVSFKYCPDSYGAWQIFRSFRLSPND